MSKVRVGVVGLGRFGANYHLRNPQSLDHKAVIAGVCDALPERAEDFASRLKVPAFTDLADLLQCQLDGLVVSTPNSHHHGQIRSALERGVPVLVDKPLAMTEAQGEDVVCASQELGVPVATCLTRHFVPSVCFVRERFETDDLGSVPVITAVQRWHRPDALPEDGGFLHRRAIHMFDAIPWIAQSPIETVRARLGHDDSGETFADVRLGLASGLEGHYLGVRDSHQNQDEISIYGTLASYRVCRDRLFAGQSDGSWRQMQTEALSYSGTEWFVDLIRDEMPPEHRDRLARDSRDGLQALRVLEAVVEAAHTGGVVTLTSVSD